MDIKQLFSTFKRWLWLVVLGTIIGGALGYYISNRQTPVYQAQARFVILPAAQTTYDYYSYLNNLNIISTYTQLLTTEDLLFEASNRLGFPVMKGQATATQVGETQFVVLTVKDTDPYKAAVIANVIRSEMTIETGITRRGKYTLPKRCALAVNVVEVLVRQVEK